MSNKVNINLTQVSIQEDKLLSIIGNTQYLVRVFHAFKNYQLQLGKRNDSPEVIYINKKIKDLEGDLLILKSSYLDMQIVQHLD